MIVSKKRIERLMRQASLEGVSRRRGWCVTTRRDREAGLASDLVNRRFAADAPNPLWVAGMTYRPLGAGVPTCRWRLTSIAARSWAGPLTRA